jgi:hypothetical protein
MTPLDINQHGPSGPPALPEPPRLLDQLGDAARAAGHNEPTVAGFLTWVRRYILFHGKRHRREPVLADVGRFLAHVVQVDKNPDLALSDTYFLAWLR